MLMKKGDRRKVICAAVVKGRTAVGNDWLAERLRTAVRMADDLDGLKSGWQKCDGGACWVWRLC
jgi:hypothetical protein